MCYQQVDSSGSSTYGCGFSHSSMFFFQVFEDYAKLDKVLAAFYEGVRMFRKSLFFFCLFNYNLSFLDFPKIIFLFRKNGLYIYIAPGHLLIREAAEDTVLEIPKPHGEVGTTTIPIRKGVQVSFYKVINKKFYFLNFIIMCLQVIVDMVGLRTFFFPLTTQFIGIRRN